MMEDQWVRTKRGFGVLLLFAVCGAGLIWPGKASALSCAPPPAVSEEFAASETVFRGTVTSKTKTENGTSAVFQVHEVWKGEVGAETALLESDMWLEFKLGEQYIVYIDADRDSQRARLCGNTKLWNEGEAEIAALKEASIARYDNEPKRTTGVGASARDPAVSGSGEQGQAGVIWTVLGLGVAAVGLAVCLRVLKKRASRK